MSLFSIAVYQPFRDFMDYRQAGQPRYMKTAPRTNRELSHAGLESCLFVFANLVANGAGSFAGRLAGSRAFAAATGFQRLIQHCFVNGLDVFHESPLLWFTTYFILPCFRPLCK
jgi:hypothetical protein